MLLPGGPREEPDVPFCQQHGGVPALLPVLVPIQLCRAGTVGSCTECRGGERVAENADCLLLHLCNHYSRVRLQEDDKIAE